jgi:hypothetical protein
MIKTLSRLIFIGTLLITDELTMAAEGDWVFVEESRGVTIYSRQVAGHSEFEFIGNIASAPQYAVLGEKLKQKYGKGN